MSQPIPYLAFDRTGAEAMLLREGAARHARHHDEPAIALRRPLPTRTVDRVMHARLEFGDGTSLYAGDCPPGMPYQGMHGVSIALNYDSVEEAQQIFDALAEGGTVTLPFSDTFWAKKFGMAKDRFGCHWMVNGGQIEMRLAA